MLTLTVLCFFCTCVSILMISAAIYDIMMTSSNGSIFRVTGLCVGNSPVTCVFPSQRPVTRSFDSFFDVRLNKPLAKQSWGWSFETPSRSLWSHCNVLPLFSEQAWSTEKDRFSILSRINLCIWNKSMQSTSHIVYTILSHGSRPLFWYTCIF